MNDMLKFVLTICVGISLLLASILGTIEYMFYLKKEREHNYKKEACESFAKQNPSEKVFYSRGVGCRIKHGEHWYSL